MSEAGSGNRQGGCLCTSVRYEIAPPIRDIIVCHCRQCAKWTGHVVAATAVASEHFTITKGNENICWFASSDEAERGFCSTCGANLFWRRVSGTHISILAGTLDDTQGLSVAGHIHTGDGHAYLPLADAAPHLATGPADNIQPLERDATQN